jgi:hypothetical protein
MWSIKKNTKQMENLNLTPEEQAKVKLFEKTWEITGRITILFFAPLLIMIFTASLGKWIGLAIFCIGMIAWVILLFTTIKKILDKN